jgi:hypothetical protein
VYNLDILVAAGAKLSAGEEKAHSVAGQAYHIPLIMPYMVVALALAFAELVDPITIVGLV